MSRAKVLVIEDEDDITRAISMRLRSAGYQVVNASNGGEAMRAARCEAPDLMILDIGLPDQDGHEVADRMLHHPETMSIPIIFLTARIAKEDRTRAYQVGAIAYLNKPFQSQDLLTAVERALAASRQIRSL